MRKLFIITAVGTITLSSCKKDWDCECHIIGTDDSVIVGIIKDKTKKDARSRCVAYFGDAFGGKVLCDLK